MGAPLNTIKKYKARRAVNHHSPAGLFMRKEKKGGVPKRGRRSSLLQQHLQNSGGNKGLHRSRHQD